MDWFLYDRELCYKLNEITLEKTIKLHSEEILSNLYLPIVPTVVKVKVTKIDQSLKRLCTS